MSAWGTCALPSTVKLKTCKSALQAMGIVSARREQVRLSEPAEHSVEAGVPTETDCVAEPLNGGGLGIVLRTCGISR